MYSILISAVLGGVLTLIAWFKIQRLFNHQSPPNEQSLENNQALNSTADINHGIHSLSNVIQSGDGNKLQTQADVIKSLQTELDEVKRLKVSLQLEVTRERALRQRAEDWSEFLQLELEACFKSKTLKSYKRDLSDTPTRFSKIPTQNLAQVREAWQKNYDEGGHVNRVKDRNAGCPETEDLEWNQMVHYNTDVLSGKLTSSLQDKTQPTCRLHRKTQQTSMPVTEIISNSSSDTSTQSLDAPPVNPDTPTCHNLDSLRQTQDVHTSQANHSNETSVHVLQQLYGKHNEEITDNNPNILYESVSNVQRTKEMWEDLAQSTENIALKHTPPDRRSNSSSPTQTHPNQAIYEHQRSPTDHYRTTSDQHQLPTMTRHQHNTRENGDSGISMAHAASMTNTDKHDATSVVATKVDLIDSGSDEQKQLVDMSSSCAIPRDISSQRASNDRDINTSSQSPSNDLVEDVPSLPQQSTPTNEYSKHMGSYEEFNDEDSGTDLLLSESVEFVREDSSNSMSSILRHNASDDASPNSLSSILHHNADIEDVGINSLLVIMNNNKLDSNSSDSVVLESSDDTADSLSLRYSIDTDNTHSNLQPNTGDNANLIVRNNIDSDNIRSSILRRNLDSCEDTNSILRRNVRECDSLSLHSVLRRNIGSSEDCDLTSIVEQNLQQDMQDASKLITNANTSRDDSEENSLQTDDSKSSSVILDNSNMSNSEEMSSDETDLDMLTSVTQSAKSRRGVK